MLLPLSNPTAILSAQFGELTLNPTINWFEGCATWNGEVIEICFDNDGDRDLECDGWGSPFFDTTLTTGCNCDTAGVSPAWALLLLVIVRRRR